jgi:flagellar motor switch protein FliG
MSILSRYKRPGGFRQLIQLIETSHPPKQEKLLQAIAQEDPYWADLLREKQITPEMVLSWSEDHLLVVFENMNPRHCAVILYGFEPERIQRFFSGLRGESYRQLKQELEDSESPSTAQLQMARSHMLEVVRHLDEEKKIDLRYIDPSLDLSEAA